MKKKIVVILSILFYFVIIKDVNAMICSRATIDKLQYSVTNIQYNYEVSDKNYYYNLNFYNINDELVIIDVNNPKVRYKPNEKGQVLLVLYGADDKLTKTFEVWSADEECYPLALRTIEIEFPKINSAAFSALCTANKELDECKRQLENPTLITFKDLKSKAKNSFTSTENSNSPKKDNIIYYVIGGVSLLIIIILIIMYFISMKKRKSRGV